MSTRFEKWGEIEDISIYGGTAGLSSALQVVNSTSVSMNIRPIYINNVSPAIPLEQEESEGPYLRDLLDEIIKKHRKILEALS